MVAPIPMPMPFTARISGFEKSSRVSIMPAKPYCPATNDGSVPRAAISSRSVPAENARPAPVMTTTATA